MRMNALEVANAVLEAVCVEIAQNGDLLLLQSEQAAIAGHVNNVDPVDVEATLNKRHLTDLVPGAVFENSYEKLMACGRAIIKIWSERIALHFPSHVVLFFLGGAEDVVLRFHVRRKGIADWTDLNDRDFLISNRLEIYELRGERLEKIAPRSSP